MSYITITVEGGLLPDDLLDRIASGDAPGQRASDFRLDSARLADEIQSAYSDAQRHWAAFQSRYRQAVERKNVSPTTVTRESWIEPLLERLDYQLEFQRAHTVVGEQTFEISYRAGAEPSAPPVHVIGCDADLDKRGERRRSPHATIQEYLNRSDSVWGIVTNGTRLRLLRNSTQIAKPRYVEFDLAGMMESSAYSDFALFYRLIHRSRLPHSAADVHECWLEKYYDEGIEQGGRVRERLRDGVEAALKTLGNAFVQHPRNDELRAAIASGRLTAPAFYRELLRLVYRMLFLIVAEERRLMFPDSGENESRRAIFSEYYGVNRLRRLVDRYIVPNSEIDLWESLKRTFQILRNDTAAHQLGMAALNGELFGPHGCPNLEAACCRNDKLLEALRALATFDDDGVRRRVNFGALDVEELGSVYESLLDYHPELTPARSFAGEDQGEGSGAPAGFDLVAGSERKTTGSYYTPPDLVRELIESALVPVMIERIEGAKTREDKIAALLGMRIVDPAAGSGHFLLATARRVGKELARIRTGEEEPAPSEYRHAVRDVIRECIYAVDKNPLAVDLCKVALWIEGHNAGQPLSFLDHHVKCGDSLVGVFDLKVLEQGIPDDAYKAVTGDDKEAVKFYRKRNREERESGQMTFGAPAPPPEIVAGFEALAHIDELSPADVEKKEAEYARLREGREWMRRKYACDAWTAAFFVPLKLPEYRGQDTVPTTATVTALLAGHQAHGKLTQEISKAATEYSFFHWPLEFPDVFARGGFDVVLGNPPWERIKLQEREFFANRDPEIASAPNKAARDKLIKGLERRQPELWEAWQTALHGAEGQSKFVRESERFPLCGRGDVNTYSIFAELARALAGKSGRAGIIVPSGIATDDTTKYFFRDLMESRTLASLYDFENRLGIFPAVHRSYKFCLLTMTGGNQSASPDAQFVFFALRVEDLRDENRRISLTAEDIALLNPNTRTCPIFRTRRDAEITKAIYRRVPVLIKECPPEENPWGVKFATMFHMSNDSHLFRTREQLERDGWTLMGNVFAKSDDRYLPLYEAKMVNLFDHRHGNIVGSDDLSQLSGIPARPTSDAEHSNPRFSPLPRYWVGSPEVLTCMGAVGWQGGFFICTRDVARSTDVRTAIQAIIPAYGVGHKAPLILPFAHRELLPSFYAAMNSFCFDYLIRQKIGGASLSYFILKQTPMPDPEQVRNMNDFVRPRVLELTYTAWDVQPFARDLCYEGPPFTWNAGRRFLIRCELDAAFFHLYGISRDDAEYIMETFPIVKRKDEQRFGEYRTKRVILEIYDEMAEAIRTGRPYQTRLDPPPGSPLAAHERSATAGGDAQRT
jgi:hypothetical protein